MWLDQSGRMRRVLVAAAALVFLTAAQSRETAEDPGIARAVAANAGSAVPVPVALLERGGTELSGDWRYIVDPNRSGLRKPNYRRAFFEDAKPTDGRLIEYDFDTSPTLKVPGDWNSQVESLGLYDGLIWYRTRFTAAPTPGKTRVLAFEAVNYRAHVYLNGKKLGVHDGGFTPFAYNVTGALANGDNSLVVGVDAEPDATSIPALDFDWQNYGGITRPVHLLTLPATYVEDFRVWIEGEGPATRLKATIRLAGAARTGQAASLAIRDLGMTLTARTDAAGTARFDVAAPRKLLRWSPDRPRLYRVAVAGAGDRVIDDIGFRTVAVRGTDILLNGRPLFLKGISLHEEAIGAVGTRAVGWKEAEALLGQAKALGANFVRLAHYPHNERMTRLADRLGLIVWSEIPIYWEDIAYANPATLALARQMLLENIRRDANRASIAVWSVANETPITEARNAFLRSLIATARAEDPTRLISAALNKNSVAGDTITIDDPLGADLDLIAVNTYEGWYGSRTLDDIAKVRWQSRYAKPMIFSEFGADALFGFHADASVRWSEEYQAKLFTETLKMAATIPFLRGLSPWVLKDFRSPRRYHGKYQNYWNRKGLIDPEGRRKLAFAVLAQEYSRR